MGHNTQIVNHAEPVPSGLKGSKLTNKMQAQNATHP